MNHMNTSTTVQILNRSILVALQFNNNCIQRVEVYLNVLTWYCVMYSPNNGQVTATHTTSHTVGQQNTI